MASAEPFRKILRTGLYNRDPEALCKRMKEWALHLEHTIERGVDFDLLALQVLNPFLMDEPYPSRPTLAEILKSIDASARAETKEACKIIAKTEWAVSPNGKDSGDRIAAAIATMVR